MQHTILARSDKNLISAKGVRKELQVRRLGGIKWTFPLTPPLGTRAQELFPDLDVKMHKAAIDSLTVQAFEHGVRPLRSTLSRALTRAPQVSAEDLKPDLPKVLSKRPRSPSSPTSSPAFPLAQKPKVKHESDEVYAQRLQAELNGNRTTRGEASGENEKRKKKLWKSRAKTTIGSDDEGGKKRKVSQTGFNKPHRLSEAMADVVGAEVMSRPQVVKHLWIYIKANECVPLLCLSAQGLTFAPQPAEPRQQDADHVRRHPAQRLLWILLHLLPARQAHRRSPLPLRPSRRVNVPRTPQPAFRTLACFVYAPQCPRRSTSSLFCHTLFVLHCNPPSL